jgi:rSAM/selenodomain-associated transferase 1
MAAFIDSSNKHYAYPQYRLLVFAKSPILGAAKTRMQPLLPKEFSLALHCQLLKTVLTQWSEPAICPIDCWIAGDEATFIEKIIKVDMPNLKTLPLFQQRGCDLGERLSCAIATTFADNSHSNTTANKAVQAHKNIQGVFVVGTDCPSLSAEYLKIACSMLAHYDAVIGPAEDGGYVLLGLKAPNAELFKGIEWGGSSVLGQTLSKLRDFNLSYFELPALADIDHPEDLVMLQKHHAFNDLLAQAAELIGRHR